MTKRRGIGGLTGQMKAALIGAARQGKEGTTQAVRPPAAKEVKRLAFADLPEYSDYKTQRAVADMLGIDVPFFRTHEARAGATATIDGRTLINFGSYDYLGLNGDPRVQQAAKDAVDRYGISASASRVVAGERDIHRRLEKRIAEVIGVEDAVVFVSGHATNVAAIGTLLRPNDLLVYDSLIHNSILVGAKLSGCARRPFPHNDLDALEALMADHRGRHERVIIAVESHYSMDGDTPDIARLIDIKERYGAWLMVDEAHGLGVLGRHGRGIAEHAGVDPHAIDIWMGTLSKTLAGCGGFIAGDTALCEFLKLTAPGFVYSVGLPPPVTAAAIASLDVMMTEPERVAKLNANARFFLECAQAAGLDTGTSEGRAIVPVMVGDSIRATALASRLLDRGINAMPILYPAVPEKAARLRFFLSSEHTQEQIRTAIAATAEELGKLARSGIGIRTVAAAAKMTRGSKAPLR